LRRHGLKVAILSRGYRRKETLPVILQPSKLPDDIALNEDNLAKAGDEPLMMARLYEQTVGVGADRVQSARELLRRENVDAFVLDDGFSAPASPTRCRSRSSRQRLFGRMLPAGPFRETATQFKARSLLACHRSGSRVAPSFAAR
jgi:tetraacyldisaccharide-1-P 4'-kinase